LQIVEHCGDKPSDAKIWRQLLAYAPPWTVMEAAFRIWTQRREQRVELQRACSRASD
jgi:hypothetical protein